MLLVSRGPLRSTGRIRRGRWLPVAFADLAIDGGGMPRLSRIRAAAGSIVRTAIRRNAREFLKATEHCRDTQQRVLHDLLKLNDGSRFQREHGLHRVRTVDDFRERLPIADFEYFRPYIEDVKQGDHAALLGSGNRLLMFTLSSGTTAESKFIPITRRFLNDYRRGWQIWGIRALDKHSQINGQTILQLSSNFDQFRTAGNTPCGNISGLVAAMQKRIVRSMFSVPVVVSQISDTTAKLYTALRLSMADPEIGMITTANPSTLIQMAKLGNELKQDLIRDIADGRLSPKIDVSPSVRSQLNRLVRRRNKTRAQQLESIVDRCGSLLPKDYWCQSRLLAVWTGGSAGAYLNSLRTWFGEVPIRDHGLSASEGRMTIPLEDGRSDGVLDVTTHFFEFIPVSQHGYESPDVLEAHELQQGEDYYILLTTSSGLYRYDIRDVVRCTGFCGTTPMLEFLHKGAHISNITGEKVSESQVANAVSATARQLGLALEHFTVAPVWGEPPEYQLLLEERDVGAPRMREMLVSCVDFNLQQVNCEYREKRGSGRLAPMSCVALADGTWDRFIANRISRVGGSLEQYKHPCLVPDLDFKRQVTRMLAPRSRSTSTVDKVAATGKAHLGMQPVRD